MIDARRLEVYTAFLNSNGDFESEVKAEIINEQSFVELLENRRIYFFGDGADKCASIIKNQNAMFSTGFKNSAKHMISISNQMFIDRNFKDVAYFEPFYLKDFVATVAKNKVIN
jgi:tRNA threonylcarbamoyladenosine biosynthesis protein TsaB